MILNKEKFFKQTELIPYYKRNATRRWGYMSKVIEEIMKCQFETILEIGAYKINMTSISDNMDLFEKYIPEENRKNKMYIQDATDVPWDIPDKYYDLTVALQTFEHFEGKQLEVFDEIMRTSLQAIISIPWKWNCPEDINHHNINEYHLTKWFDDTPTYRTHEVMDRLILCYRF